MNPNKDFYHYSGNNRQGIYALAQRIEALNSLLDVFGSNEARVQPLANDRKAITDWLINDFEETMETLMQLVEVEAEVEDGIE